MEISHFVHSYQRILGTVEQWTCTEFFIRDLNSILYTKSPEFPGQNKLQVLIFFLVTPAYDISLGSKAVSAHQVANVMFVIHGRPCL